MQKTLLIILLLPFAAYSQEPKILLQDYNFLVMDGQVSKLHQSNDTLYEQRCYIYRPCLAKPKKHYKIISSLTADEFTILKLERLDTIPLTSNTYPSTRYSVLALKNIDNKQVGYLPLIFGLTREQIDTTDVNVPSLKDKFFFTYFSDTFIKELTALKKITTREEAQEIIDMAKSDKIKILVENYKKTETRDMYASGLSAEIINLACIERGYNPVGAGQAIDSLIRQ